MFQRRGAVAAVTPHGLGDSHPAGLPVYCFRTSYITETISYGFDIAYWP
jgi:hypothetical protein